MIDFDVELFNQVVKVACEITASSFAFSTILIFFTYGIFKAFSLLKIKD